MTDDEHRSRFIDFLFGGYIDRRAQELSRKQTREHLQQFIGERQAEERRANEARQLVLRRLERLILYDRSLPWPAQRQAPEPLVSRGTAQYLQEWFAK